jgi:hypothetical protein
LKRIVRYVNAAKDEPEGLMQINGKLRPVVLNVKCSGFHFYRCETSKITAAHVRFWYFYIFGKKGSEYVAWKAFHSAHCSECWVYKQMHPFLAWNMVTLRNSRGVLCSIARRIQQMGTVSLHFYIYQMEIFMSISYEADHGGRSA